MYTALYLRKVQMKGRLGPARYPVPCRVVGEPSWYRGPGLAVGSDDRAVCLVEIECLKGTVAGPERPYKVFKVLVPPASVVGGVGGVVPPRPRKLRGLPEAY